MMGQLTVASMVGKFLLSRASFFQLRTYAKGSRPPRPPRKLEFFVEAITPTEDMLRDHLKPFQGVWLNSCWDMPTDEKGLDKDIESHAPPERASSLPPESRERGRLRGRRATMSEQEALTWLRSTLQAIRKSPRMPRKTLEPAALQNLKVAELDQLLMRCPGDRVEWHWPVTSKSERVSQLLAALREAPSVSGGSAPAVPQDPEGLTTSASASALILPSSPHETDAPRLSPTSCLAGSLGERSGGPAKGPPGSHLEASVGTASSSGGEQSSVGARPSPTQSGGEGMHRGRPVRHGAVEIVQHPRAGPFLGRGSDLPGWFSAPEEVARVLHDAKTDDVVIVDVRGRSVLADYFVVATARSQRHVFTAANAVKYEADRRAADSGKGVHAFRSPRVTGSEGDNWIVIDAGTIVAHVFTETARPMYNLEGIWGGTGASIQDFRDAVPLQ
eukprot:jgi/Botrbrau1/5834/Bobra.0366s0016.1